MSKEQEDPNLSLQRSLFSDELVDTRTREQKRKARLQHAPVQNEMFSPHEVVYQRVNPHPEMPIPDHIAVPFLWTDPRTPEEIEADIMREAAKLTIPMFPESDLALTVKPEPLLLLPPPKAQLLLDAHSVVPEPPSQEIARASDKTSLPLMWKTFRQREQRRERDRYYFASLLPQLKSATERTERVPARAPATTYPTEGPEPKKRDRDRFIPIGHISVADLVARHPNLGEEIHSLSDDEFDLIAENVYDVLLDTYYDTFEDILLNYLVWRESLDTPEEMPTVPAGTKYHQTSAPIATQQSLPLG